MKYAIGMLILLVVTGTALGQAGTSAAVEAMTPLLGQGDPPESLTRVPGYDARLKADYLAALQPKAEALTGATKALALMQLYRDLVGWGKNTTGLADRMVAAIDAAAVSNPGDKARLVSTLYANWYLYRAAALRYVDTPGLTPQAQRVADALGVYLGRHEPKNVAAALSLRTGIERPIVWRTWPLEDKVSLRRLLAIMPVADHARYVTLVNAHLVKSRATDLARSAGDYQAYLKDGAGGTNLLDGVTIPADDPLSVEANRLLSDPDLTLDVDCRLDLLLLAGRNKEAFQAAEATMDAQRDPKQLSANIHRLAKVIKAIDGHWKRATDYVNLFQPRAEGDPPVADPIPDVKRELGL